MFGGRAAIRFPVVQILPIIPVSDSSNVDDLLPCLDTPFYPHIAGTIPLVPLLVFDDLLENCVTFSYSLPLLLALRNARERTRLGAGCFNRVMIIDRVSGLGPTFKCSKRRDSPPPIRSSMHAGTSAGSLAAIPTRRPRSMPFVTHPPTNTPSRPRTQVATQKPIHKISYPPSIYRTSVDHHQRARRGHRTKTTQCCSSFRR